MLTQNSVPGGRYCRQWLAVTRSNLVRVAHCQLCILLQCVYQCRRNRGCKGHWDNIWTKINFFYSTPHTHWTYWLQILSKLYFQREALSGNYEIVAISTDKNTFFNDLDYKADIGQHFHRSEKSTRRRHRHKIIKTNLKTLHTIRDRS
jgi:hypothetical protein